nr:unnamed protein product [Callosobruchus chinensis]
MHTRNFLFSPQGGRSSYIKNERYDRTFIPRVSRAWNGLPGMYLMSRRELDYSSLASTSFP